jgi:hypothetical protein
MGRASVDEQAIACMFFADGKQYAAVTAGGNSL